MACNIDKMKCKKKCIQKFEKKNDIIYFSETIYECLKISVGNDSLNSPEIGNVDFNTWAAASENQQSANAKTKMQISCAVTAQLISIFVLNPSSS